MQVHFFAAARSAAGTAQLSVPLAELPSATLGALIEHLGQSLEGTTPSGLTLAQVMEQCSFLVWSMVPVLMRRLRCRMPIVWTFCLPLRVDNAGG